MRSKLPGESAWRALGVGALLLVVALAVPGCRRDEPVQPVERPNVLLVTLDTTRADHLGVYGYRRPTTPALDQLAKESQVYEHAYTTSSWTLPAHASLFTGLVPTVHGARKDPDGELILSAEVAVPESWNIYRARAPRDDVPTLAGLLGDAGWSTAGIVGGPWLKRAFGLGRGFAHWDDDDVGADGRRGSAVTERARAWLAQAPRPFFLFLNYFDPHTPYDAPPAYVRYVLGGETFPRNAGPDQKQALLYDAEIRYTDDQIGLLLGELRRLGLYDSTWVIVTSDHGELLGEHGRVGHGLTLDEVLVRVPLLVKPPRGVGRPGRVAAPIQLDDVMPMLLEALGLATPAGIQGVAPEHARERSAVFAEVNPLPAESEDGEYRAWIEGDWKLVWNSLGHHELYDLATDPGEDRNLASAEPARLAGMKDRLGRYVASLPPPPAAKPARNIDPETAKSLRSLGYVQ